VWADEDSRLSLAGRTFTFIHREVQLGAMRPAAA